MRDHEHFFAWLTVILLGINVLLIIGIVLLS